MKGKPGSSLRARLAALLLAAAFPALLLSGCSPAARAILGLDPFFDKDYYEEMDDLKEREERIIKQLEEDGMDPEEARKEAFKRVIEYNEVQKGWVDPWEYYRVYSCSELFEAMRKKEVPLAIRVQPIGREGDEVLYDIDNEDPFTIDLTEGSVTEWETTFKKVNSDKVETFRITFTAMPRSNDLLSAATWYEPADPQTDDPAMFLISQMFDPDQWKQYFSVKNVAQNGKSQRIMFKIYSVYLASQADAN